MRATILGLEIIAVSVWAANISLAGDLVHGSWNRPACGKVCKLVCETKKLSAIGYGYECDTICIPGPGRPGCKHCDATCCGGDDLKGCPPKVEFCWYDWFACGCAQPRTVKLLTKYQAEKEIGWFHWEVVDAACCGCVAESGEAAPDRSIYKPAPDDAQLGDILPMSDEEWSELATVLRPDEVASSNRLDGKSVSPPAAEPIAPALEPERISLTERLGRLFGR